ncbi:hypothetical protein J2T10_004147 [Paenarthrobacter nicotinovorans]|uniref:Uncharacterized protein n=1 Tax=Paenarthrobacter nicotinovorans TaxID=29320 RepID=A0ABT9TVR8_PAENI|nr:hypothetical protein [Paenarthrobacter nicotinovorans]MDQ0104472.1 hypothetical protein [Paenarthrobacter nicotinovorans]
MNEFHALLAQVIPVLLLAAAFESKVLQQAPKRYGFQKVTHDRAADSRVSWDTNFFQSIGMAIIVGFIGIGEALAIWCVYTGDHLSWQNAWVLLAGVATLVLVIGPLVSLHWRDFREALRLLGAGWRMWPWIAVVLIAIIGCLLWLVSAVAEYVPTNPN